MFVCETAKKRVACARGTRADAASLATSTLLCLPEQFEGEIGMAFLARTPVAGGMQDTLLFEASEATQCGCGGAVLDYVKSYVALPRQGWSSVAVPGEIVRTLGCAEAELRRLRAGFTKTYVVCPWEQQLNGCSEAFLEGVLRGDAQHHAVNRVQLASLVAVHHMVGASSVQPGELRVCEHPMRYLDKGGTYGGKLFLFSSCRLPLLQPLEPAAAPLLSGYSQRTCAAMLGGLEAGEFRGVLKRLDKYALDIAAWMVGHGYTRDPVELGRLLRGRLAQLRDPAAWHAPNCQFVLRRFSAAVQPVTPLLLDAREVGRVMEKIHGDAAWLA